MLSLKQKVHIKRLNKSYIYEVLIPENDKKNKSLCELLVYKENSSDKSEQFSLKTIYANIDMLINATKFLIDHEVLPVNTEDTLKEFLFSTYFKF